MSKKVEEKGGDRPSVISITKHLQGINFPVSKQDLIEHSRKKGVDESVIKMLNEMPEKEYNSIKDVMKEYGKHYEKAA